VLLVLSLTAGVASAQVPVDAGTTAAAPPTAPAMQPKPAELPEGGAGKTTPPTTQVLSSPTGTPAERQK